MSAFLCPATAGWCASEPVPASAALLVDAAGRERGVDSAEQQRLYGLAPVADGRTQVVVLGSFPGVASLVAQQYYAHPRNQLWPLLQAVWPEHPQPLDYAGRCEWLLQRGLGLWDVYASCMRQGSLDTRIRAAETNDFAALRDRCTLLKAVVHNGGESFKHAKQVALLGVEVHRLPSTSPAHASLSFDDKLRQWREALAIFGLVNN
jgi:TDG/mug DNA glycosylase family protein